MVLKFKSMIFYIIFLLLLINLSQCGNDLISRKDDPKFNLSYNFQFENEIVNTLKLSDISKLLKKKVVVSAGEFGITLVKNDGSTIDVYTIEQYRKEKYKGAKPYTGYDRAMEQYFKIPDVVFTLIKNAKLPKASYIQNKNLTSIDLISVRILPEFNEKSEKSTATNNKMLLDYVKNKKIKIIKETEKELNLTYNDSAFLELFEIMKADFDNDGIEDMLVWSSASFQTYRTRMDGPHKILLFKLKKIDSKFEITVIE